MIVQIYIGEEIIWEIKIALSAIYECKLVSFVASRNWFLQPTMDTRKLMMYRSAVPFIAVSKTQYNNESYFIGENSLMTR